ncbi:DUF1778 domain-containing protein [Edaphobacter aggregans]|uniref:type II toxin-antitoxin system TacA family antitoxin n=1 Tax=Edaphobacter aggregans TaxID=570835 RepID=UPI0005565884|nr:DUF1778 domain-containing protein [Edaphobacter aggregans]
MATIARKAKTERAEARLRPEQKARIERAAHYRGLSFSDFLVQAADEAAVKTIEQNETWILNAEASRRFVEACLNPPEPNLRVKAAAAAYKKWVRK